ncbi:MAG: rubredoxin-like domain-containing protein [Deltaproteobacteria bacterium]
MKKKWVCKECGYVCEGDAPPDLCPVCYAPAEAFAEVSRA